jgi:hypothetical protein
MDPRQNKEVERQAAQAARGKGCDYRKTPIGETQGSIATDPLRIRDSGGLVGGGTWWSHAEPSFLREQGERFARRDSARTDKRSFAMDLAYCAEPLTANIAETPDGYLVCRNAVIARSGFQKYRVAEIADPEGLLGDDYAPDDALELWRDPEEVFSAATLASFEGKSLTLGHPEKLLNPDTEQQHIVGHVQNVHKGREPLDSGDWPVLADVIVKDAAAIDAVKSGERELSCGYSYKLARTGHRWEQRNILGNHVALVPKGRAGAEARIETGPLPTSVRDERDRRSGKERENVHGGNR